MSDPLQTVLPGKSRHSTVTAKLSGLLSDPTTMVLSIIGPGGSVMLPTVVRDAAGTYHSDWVLPITAKDGVWVRRWVASGTLPSQTGIDEVRFIVPKLAA